MRLELRLIEKKVRYLHLQKLKMMALWRYACANQSSS